MSGHSKWHNIKHKKDMADSARGKIFTKHAKLISIAARDGGTDPEMNTILRTAISNAKADNVPNANIDKAIKKGAGEGKEAMAINEIMYEGFGPNGITFYIQALTDNKNRTFANLRTELSKKGGNLGEFGSVGYMYQRKGVISALCPGKSSEEAELLAIDAGAEDLSIDEGKFEIIVDAMSLMKIKDNLEKAGFHVEKAELSYLPKDKIIITDNEVARKALNLLDAIEEDEDVTNVYSNFDIADEVMEKL